MLRFAEIEDGDIKLTDVGKRSPKWTSTTQEALPRQLLPMFRSPRISAACFRNGRHLRPKSRFLDELEDHMSRG